MHHLIALQFQVIHVDLKHTLLSDIVIFAIEYVWVLKDLRNIKLIQVVKNVWNEFI